MAMVYGLRGLELPNDWQHRSTVVMPSKAYRNGEADGMVPEPSQWLRTVRFAPKGISLGRASEELAVPTRGLSALLQVLVPVAA